MNVRSIPAATSELKEAGLIKKWRHDRRTYYYLCQDGFPMSPSDMDIKTPRTTSKRPRDPSGRFINPSSMDRPNPSSMDSVNPSEMEKKNRDRRRETEEEKVQTEKKSATQSSGSARLAREPASPSLCSSLGSLGKGASEKEDHPKPNHHSPPVAGPLLKLPSGVEVNIEKIKLTTKLCKNYQQLFEQLTECSRYEKADAEAICKALGYEGGTGLH